MLAAALRWKNACRLNGARIFLTVLSVVAAACGLAEIPATGLILDWLGRNVIVTALVATCLFVLSSSRRRERAIAAAAGSWLTPLPAVISVSLTVIAGTTVRVLLVIAFAALACVLGRVDAGAAERLALATIAGAVLGSLAGRQLRRGADDSAPGFHYATVRRVRTRWASRPSLLPLSYWPAAQGRIFSRPKVLSRIAFMALVTLPMGTPGQVALAIAAASIALFGIASLSLAAIRVAFAAARWLGPTTLRRARFTAAMVWRVILTQTLAVAVMVSLACAIDLPEALRVGLALAGGFLLVSLAITTVACAWACRREGLGAASRGASPDARLAA